MRNISMLKKKLDQTAVTPLVKKRKLDLASNEVKYPKLCKWNDNFECLKVPGLFRKSNPLLQPGSRVFCKYDAASIQLPLWT